MERFKRVIMGLIIQSNVVRFPRKKDFVACLVRIGVYLFQF